MRERITAAQKVRTEATAGIENEKKLQEIAKRELGAAALKVREAAVGNTLSEVTLSDGTRLIKPVIHKITPHAIIFQSEKQYIAVETARLPADLVQRFQLNSSPKNSESGLPAAVEAAVLTELARKNESVAVAETSPTLRDPHRQLQLVRLRINQLLEQETRLLAEASRSDELHNKARERGNISGHSARAQRSRETAAKIRKQIDALEMWLTRNQP